MQITKLSFLTTQSLGDSVFAVEEVIDIPIDQVFGTYRAREKALINLIGSDGVQKVSRDTWKIVKEITLEAANVVMRKGDFFRVKLDEEGDDSPIHFDLDATGVFVLSREVFASLQTYEVLDPGKLQSIRMAFTFGGKPVVDAQLTDKFSSLTLEPIDATNGIYELKFYTSMAPSDDTLDIEVTGVSLRNSVYEAPVRITVREPILSLVPVDLVLRSEQTKDLKWQLLMEGLPAPLATPLQATPNVQSVGGVTTKLIEKVGAFKLIDATRAIYSLDVTATDEVGATSTIDTTYRFSPNYIGEIAVPITLLAKEALLITHETTTLEANQTQLIQITLKRGAVSQTPVTDAVASQIKITGQGIHSVDPVLVPIDSANGVYGYRVTTNHKGGPISVRSVLSTQGNPYPDFYNLTSRSTPVLVKALNTLPAAETADLTFQVSQQRLGGLTNLVGVVAKNFTIGGSAIAKVNGAVEQVGMGVYKVSVTTNDRGGSVPVTAILTIDGEDVDVNFSTTADIMARAEVSYTGTSLPGETTQPVPLLVKLNGQPIDVTNPVVNITGAAFVSKGTVRRTGVGTLEVSDVNVNGKGGILNLSLVAFVKGYLQTMTTGVPVTAVADVTAINIDHMRPTVTSSLMFSLTRGGKPVSSIKFGKATLTGPGVAAYDGDIDILDLNSGRFQVHSVTGSAPRADALFQVSVPIIVRGYSYTLVFNSYTEAMPDLGTGGGQTDDPNAGETDPTDPTDPEEPGTLNPGGNLSGGLDQNYCMTWKVDGQPANIESGTVTASGSVLVSGPDPILLVKENGVACITGINTSEDEGDITFDGTIVIDGITHPFHFVLHNNRLAPIASNVTVLENESIQTLFFTLKRGTEIVPDGTLTNGTVEGDAIEAFSDFALDNPLTGRYRVKVTTNDKGGPVRVLVNVRIGSTRYPLTIDTTAKSLSEVGDGSGWAVSASTPAAAKTNSITFSFTRGKLDVLNPMIKDYSVSGTTVLSSSDDAVAQNNREFKMTEVKLDSRKGDVLFKVKASSNGGLTWHDLSVTWPIDQAPAPRVTPQTSMLIARKTDVLKFTLTRDGIPVPANTITNIQVTGQPVGTANHDLVVINAAQGVYGTTITPNDLGGDINVTFDLNEGGVDYPGLTFTGKADIYHPWSASLVNGPIPEVATNVDFNSRLDDGTNVSVTNASVTVTGDCLVSPVGSTPLVYQDSTNKIYRLPNVMVNNRGGELTFTVVATYEGVEITQELKFTVVPLPDLKAEATGSDLPFQSSTNLTFSVMRGTTPSIFTNSAVKNLTVRGDAVKSYTSTVNAVSSGNYQIPVVTNGIGGPIVVSFTVTLAGIDYPLSMTAQALQEPAVTAVSTNTLATNATGTNLDFQLKRGELPCADAFVVQSIVINSRSVSSYPQTVINVNVSQGQYRIQVNTSAYSDDIPVTIRGTVRGESVTLKFTAKIVAGVLPTVNLVSSAFDEGILTTAQLGFLNGTTSINSAVTLDSIEGPLTGATLNTTGVLSGIPTQHGPIELVINFSWKGASYSGVITATANQIFPVTLTTNSQLAAYKNNIVAFQVKNEDGSDYPQGVTYSVTANGFTISTPAAQLADGSFTIGLQRNGELVETPVSVSVSYQGVVRKHMMKLSVWYNFEARFSGTIPMDSTAVSNTMQFDVYEVNNANVFSVSTSSDMDSLKVTGRGTPNNITGWSNFRFTNAYRGTFYVSSNPVDVVDADFTFNYTSPLSRVYKIPGVFRMQRAMAATWTDTSGAQGAVAKTLKVKLMSGSTPIIDAVDAATTVTNAGITKSLYLIDSATGTYGIDVMPNGAATSMVVTLKVKQPTTPTVINTFTALTVSVQPAPITATAATTAGRNSQSAGVVFSVLLSQGGSPVTDAVINSYDIAGDAVLSMYGNPSNEGKGYYNRRARTKFTGGNPQVTINATINGVGYIFNIDYPISPETPPVMFINSSDTQVSNQIGALSIGVRVGGNLIGLANATGPGGGSGLKPEWFFAASDNFSMATSALNGNYINMTVMPNAFGTQTWVFSLTIYNATYLLPLVVEVVEGGSIEILSGIPLTSHAPNTIVFNVLPKSGTTYDGTEVLSINNKPASWNLTTAPVRNPNGTYQVVFTPTTESVNQAFSMTLSKNGATTRAGSQMNINTRLSLALNLTSNNEVAGDIISASGALVIASTNQLVGWDLTVAGVVDKTTLKVIPSDPSTVDLESRAPDMVFYSSGIFFRFKSLMTDYATVRFSVNITSPVTGFVYTVTTGLGSYHDTPVYTFVGPSTLPLGKSTDVVFKLTWLTSGNPIKQGTEGSSAPTTSGFTNNGFRVIDADKGLYAFNLTPTSTADTGTGSVILRYGLTASTKLYTPASQAMMTYRGIKALIPAIGSATRNVSLLLKDSTGPIGDATITAVDSGTYLDSYAGEVTAKDVDKGVYLVPMTSTGRNRPVDTDAIPSSVDTVKVTYHRPDNVTVTLDVPVTIYHKGVRVILEDGFPSKAGTTYYMTPQGGWLNPTFNVFTSPTLTRLDGTAVSAPGGNVYNDFNVNGKVRASPGQNVAVQNDVVLLASLANTDTTNKRSWIYSDPFDVVRVPYFVMTPSSIQISGATSGSTLAAQNLPTFEITLKDDLGVPLLDVEMTALRSGNNGIQFSPYQTGGVAGPWTDVLTPKTDGSDGVYVVRLYTSGWTYGGSVSLSVAIDLTSSSYPTLGTQTMNGVSFKIN